MTKQKKYLSRRRTPWDDLGDENLNPTQKFLREKYHAHYEERHPILSQTGEAELINTIIPVKCPYCNSEKFKKQGHTKNGVQRYQCSECSGTFIPTTGTIFDGHKISISEWIEYCLNLFRYLSISADSWNNKNAFTTSRYWLEKIFLLLEDYQSSVVLGGKVWLDETYYKVRSDSVMRYVDGTELPEISINQMCIGTAYDKRNLVCFYEGLGRPSKTKTWEIFKNHIKPNSTLVHDNENTHSKLIDELSLKSIVHQSNDLKGLEDKDNPLNPINQVHRMLKLFLYSHRSFNRDTLQGYLNLFTFVFNPPHNPMEKVEKLLNRAFSMSKTLRYRDHFGVK